MLVVLNNEMASPNGEDYIIPKVHFHPDAKELLLKV